MNTIRYMSSVFAVILLSGCIQPTASQSPDPAHRITDERERVLSECMTNYTDLLEKYSALVGQNGNIQRKDSELAKFLAEYQEVQKQFASVLNENKEYREKNEQLVASQQTMLHKIQTIEDKLHVAQEEASHLKNVVDGDSPKGIVFAINPKTRGIILEDTFLFTVGSATLSEDGKKLLQDLAENLNAPEYKHLRIRVDGHTDSTPVVKTRDSNLDNWFLGAKRAHQVLTYLMESGVEKGRLSLASFGDQLPLGKEKDRGGNPQNRRVEIVLLEKE